MPFIHIKSLPLQQALDMPAVLTSIAADFSQQLSIALNHIHVSWEFYQPGHYVKGDKSPDRQPEANFPLIVDLLTPDFNNAQTIELMLKTIASSIAEHAHFPINNIFINHRQAHAGMVFDDGEIVRW